MFTESVCDVLSLLLFNESQPRIVKLFSNGSAEITSDMKPIVKLLYLFQLKGINLLKVTGELAQALMHQRIQKLSLLL